MDVATIRVVVLGLVVICCLSVGGVVVLASSGHDASPLIAVATTCTGALVGILVTPGRSAAREDGPAR